MSMVASYRKEQGKLLRRRLLGRTAVLVLAWTVAFAFLAVQFQIFAVPRIADAFEGMCPWMRSDETLDPEEDIVFAAKFQEQADWRIETYLGAVREGREAEGAVDVSDTAREVLANAESRMREEPSGESGADDRVEKALTFYAAVDAELAALREHDAQRYGSLLDEALAYYGETRETAVVDVYSTGKAGGSFDVVMYFDGHIDRRDLTAYAIARSLKVPLACVAYFAGIVVIMWSAVRRSVRSFDALFGAMEGVLTRRDLSPTLPEELAPTSAALEAIAAESRANEAAAQAAEHRKNELVAYLAHDIRTPLTSIVGYLTMLQESPDMSSEQRARWAGIALDRAYRLEGMLEEFFEITRYNLQSIPIERQRFDAAILCRQVADEFFPAAEARNLSIEVESAQPLEVFADAGKVSRVLNNLLKNAVGYADEGSAVHVRARTEERAEEIGGVSDESQAVASGGVPVPPPGYAGGPFTTPSRVNVVRELVIEVENTGREISPTHLQSIFEKFYREDSSRGTERGGAGLGLAIAREIARAHGGELSATSTQGRTAFTLRIPA